jgi:hypothetical protein
MKEKIRDLTRDAYRDAVCDVWGIDRSDSDNYREVCIMMQDVEEDGAKDLCAEERYNEIMGKKAQSSAKYLENLLISNTKTLEDIIIVHENGFIRRTDKVLEAVKSELTRRALFGDQYQSDTN